MTDKLLSSVQKRKDIKAKRITYGTEGTASSFDIICKQDMTK